MKAVVYKEPFSVAVEKRAGSEDPASQRRHRKDHIVVHLWL